MAFAKKGSRAITVDGADYRWLLSPDSGYSIIVVQSASGAGRKLAITVDWSRVTYPFAQQDGALKITPALVAKLIKNGLREGWVPTEAGRDFVCRLLSDETLKLPPSAQN